MGEERVRVDGEDIWSCSVGEVALERGGGKKKEEEVEAGRALEVMVVCRPSSPAPSLDLYRPFRARDE